MVLMSGHRSKIAVDIDRVNAGIVSQGRTIGHGLIARSIWTDRIRNWTGVLRCSVIRK